MSVLDKLRKATITKEADILADSKFFDKEMAPTQIPALNIALSASVSGGLASGHTMFAGPSKHFKSLFSLILCAAYMRKYKDAILVFFDNEFGSPKGYFESLNIDTSRILHIPIMNIEQLKHEMISQLDAIERGDKVIMFIDSIGNMASIKELDDARDQKSTADMTRSKQLKSVFRMVTPMLTIKDVPLVTVNHTYQTLEIYSKAVVSGGTGSYYSADNIFIVGRQQDKATSGADKGDLLGYHFILNVEKSRFVREKSKIPITVRHEGGVSKWSGLLDLAEEAGLLEKTTIGKAVAYMKIDIPSGEVLEKKYKVADTNNSEFWLPILESARFNEFVKDNYAVAHGDLIQDEDSVEDAYPEEEVDEV